MPLRVLLRGFQPAIPDGQPATFVEDLPDDVLCTQCSNIAPTLFTDPRGHGYCGPCRSMCLEKGRFQCAVCEASFEEQRAHLHGCHCGKDSDKQTSFNSAESSTADNSETPNLVECPICELKLPKLEAREHVKACLSKTPKMERSPSQQNVTPHKSEDTFRQAQSYAQFPRTSTPARTPASVLPSSRSFPTYVEGEEVPGVTNRSSLYLTASSKGQSKRLSELHQVVYGSACEARFRCPVCKKDIPGEEVRKHAINCFLWRRKPQEEPEPKPADVYALLNDFKNQVEEIKIQCEEQMEKINEGCAYLENFVGACREETKTEIHQVNEALRTVHKSLESKILHLQSTVQYILGPEFLKRAMVSEGDNSGVKEDYYQLYAEIEQVKEDVWKIMERTARQPSFRFP
ncbi:uncharacterized protein LOC144141023 isoform X2 [Haemaphysalis longicornis]